MTEGSLTDVARSICDANGLCFSRALGDGTFKMAFRVETASGEPMALKVLRRVEPSPRTAREVKAMLRCEHPSIARLLAFETHAFRDERYQYMLEEFLQGGSLQDQLESRGELDSDRSVVAIARPLISALEYLRQLDLVHRDIKPANIMLSEDGRPVLVDFGTVRDLRAISLTPTWLPRGPGTPYFASPEQLNNEKHLVDWRSDQFALGVTLHFARTGRHPYQLAHESAYAASTVQRVASRRSRPACFYDPVREGPLSAIEAMTAPWPVQRYRTPRGLAVAWGGLGGYP